MRFTAGGQSPKKAPVHSLPFPRSYWAEPARLLAGCYPGDVDPRTMRAKLAGLVRAGVTRVINLMEADESGHGGRAFVPYEALLCELAAEAGRNIVCQRFPVRDLSVPAPGLMGEILAAIGAEIERGGTVYVHCWGGRGRTGTVVGCHLVESAGLGGEEALARIGELTGPARALFHPTPETEEQRAMVRSWAGPGRDGGGRRERFHGALLGLAAGDAVGTTLEFRSAGSFEPIDDLVGGGPFGLKAGEWTDDTSMALCLASSLVECGGFDPRDQMERYVRWWREGYLSVRGSCFDIGNTVAGALRRFQADGNPWAGSTSPDTAGNGSLMRLAPVPLFFAEDPAAAIEWAGESSRTTHGAPEAVDACRYMAGLIVGALQGASKEELLSSRYSPLGDGWKARPLAPRVDAVAAGSFKERRPPQIRGSGYVVDSLEAALWAFHSTDDFRSGCLRAANLGEDADTTAAVFGQLAGAFYGRAGIPGSWRGKIAMGGLIEALAERLFQAGGLKKSAQ